jgi:hypothetical protein
MSLRAGPLSDDKVIGLLNGYFVPVYAPYASEETEGVVSVEEENEIQRIWRESLERKVGYGMVHVYLLEPATGHPFDSIGVVKASITNNLLDFLGKAVDRYKVKEGKPLVKPGRQVFPSQVPPDSLVLHLTARDLGCLKPGPAEPRARDCNVGNWKEFAAENSIVLDKAEWSKLAPPQGAASWKIPQEVASKILVYFYPQLEANVVSNHRVNDGVLTASVASTTKGIVRIRLGGTLSMKRVQEPNAVFVEAPLVGYYDYDPAKRRIQTFRLMAENGTSGSRSFGVAVRSVAAEELTSTAPSK